MQLLYVANRGEKRAADRSVARRRRRRHLRSLPRVEHCLRRSARHRRGMADGDPAVPADAEPDDPARHRARKPPLDASQPAATASSAISTLLARVRASYRRQATAAGWVRLAGERPKAEVAADVIRGCRTTARAAVSTLTSAAPASRSTRAHASTVAPVVHTSSTSTHAQPVDANVPAQGERLPDVGVPLRRGQAGL